MSKYNRKIRTLLEGLSDFWLVFFQEVDQLEVFYQGAEILVGQAYLDMLALLLNNSVQDATLFNKEFFKLVQVRESELSYREGSVASNHRYVYSLEDNVADFKYLNNKILSVTQSLDKGIDFFIDTENRTANFTFDPTNAYKQYTFGSGNGAFTVRSKYRGETLRVWLSDTGTLTPAVSRSGFGLDILIQYDGPANTSTTTASSIVSSINTHPEISGLISAELAINSTGAGSPSGTVGFTDLIKVEANPLNGYATRAVTSAFSSKFTVNGISDWVTRGVEKGDTLRLISGSNIGSPQEHTISLVRNAALYTDVGIQLDRDAGTRMEYAILRTPADNTSIAEAISPTGLVQQSGNDGVITAAVREFSSATANFSDVHAGDIIEIAGSLNAGAAVILSVVNSTTVELASTSFVDEVALNWTLRTVVSATNLGADGVLTNNNDGTATFSAASATFVSAGIVNTCIKLYRAGALEIYAVVGYTNGTTITLAVPTTVSNGAALTWGHADARMPVSTLLFSPPTAWPTVNTIAVKARRLVDAAAVQENRDYRLDLDSGRIEALTVWQTSLTNTATYQYRFAVESSADFLQSGANGTLTVGSPNTFSAPSASFNNNHVGYAIKIDNSSVPSGSTNNGTYIIAAITSATTVQLTNDRALNPVADTNNGSLEWQLQTRGAQLIDNVVTTEQEIAFWAPDALIDRYHLYNTYGYLIGRFGQSSEQYRSLIRGIFQLFMLGPTLERFESAINLVAGFEVIRDSGELLLSYNSGAEQTGTDGVFDFSSKTFTAASASFTVADIGKYIFVIAGANVNNTFQIRQLIDSTSVFLDKTPVSDTLSEWEVNPYLVQEVKTSRRTYRYSRSVPIRTPVKDPANFGVKIFEAFEVLTDAFNVTDYIESPTWWKNIQIPAELMPDEDVFRRQSAPTLFENTLDAPDDGRIGDPGFRIGTDSEGFTPMSTFLYDDGGLSDGVLIPDILYPFSLNHYFETTTNTLFSDADIGNVLVVDPAGAPRTYLITAFDSSSRIKIESFAPIEAPLTGLDWEIRSQPVPMRHKMAFIVLDRYLKQHLFSVTFNSALLQEVSGDLILDLQELVFIAKPSYTYIILTPFAFFQETIRVNEDTLELDPTFTLAGPAGEHINPTPAPLLVGGDWRIGSWFRYIDNVDTFATPTATVTNTLGVPDAGYAHYLTKISLDYTAFTSTSVPIQLTDFVSKTFASGGSLTLSVTGDEGTVTFNTPTLTDAYLMMTLVITGSGLGNDGEYILGAVASSTVARIHAPGLVNESGLNYSLVTRGSAIGTVRITDQGEVFFDDDTGLHLFDPADVGTYIRRPFITNPLNQVFPIYEVLAPNSTSARIARLSRVSPGVVEPDHVGAITNDGGAPVLDLTTVTLFITNEMLRDYREYAYYATSLKDQYFIRITSGANSGARRRLKTIAGDYLYFDGATWTADASASFVLEVEAAPTVVAETSNWEHVQNQVVVTGADLDLSNTPAQDVDVVSYTAYGIREPIDPSVEVFDEANGDTYYTIGMADPRPVLGRTRTGKETDLREDPIQITRTP